MSASGGSGISLVSPSRMTTILCGRGGGGGAGGPAGGVALLWTEHAGTTARHPTRASKTRNMLIRSLADEITATSHASGSRFAPAVGTRLLPHTGVGVKRATPERGQRGSRGDDRSLPAFARSYLAVASSGTGLSVSGRSQLSLSQVSIREQAGHNFPVREVSKVAGWCLLRFRKVIPGLYPTTTYQPPTTTHQPLISPQSRPVDIHFSAALSAAALAWVFGSRPSAIRRSWSAGRSVQAWLFPEGQRTSSRSMRCAAPSPMSNLGSLELK